MYSKGAPALRTPLETSSPASRCTGKGSPVSADSSRVARALKIPSVGVISPERMSKRSPMFTLSMAISSIEPSLETR